MPAPLQVPSVDREVGIAAPLPSQESKETFVLLHSVGVVGGLKHYWLSRHFTDAKAVLSCEMQFACSGGVGK